MSKKQRERRAIGRTPRADYQTVAIVLEPFDGWEFPSFDDIEGAIIDGMCDAIDVGLHIPITIDVWNIFLGGMDYGWISVNRRRGRAKIGPETYVVHDPDGRYAQPPAPSNSRKRKGTADAQMALV